MKLYSVTQEAMTTWFGTKRAARQFDRKHDEPQGVVTHALTVDEVAARLNVWERAMSAAPFSWYWECVHVASGAVVNSGFVRAAARPDFGAAVNGFTYRFTPLYNGEGK